MNRKCLYAFATSVIVTVTMMVSGCNFWSKPVPEPSPVYGVADLETLVKAHPKYSEYFKLETEYKEMLAKYQQERLRLIQTSAEQKKVQSALEDQTRRMAAETEFKAKVKNKENELNQRLQERYKAINDKHNIHKGPVVIDSLTPEERAEMANLQMKLTILGVSGEEKESIKNRLHELMEMRMLRDSASMVGWTQEEMDEMKQEKEKAQKELEAFSAQTAEDIKSGFDEMDKKNLEASANAESDKDSAWNAMWQQRIDWKQKQMAAIKSQIMEDIREKAQIVASENGMTMIFVKYKANIKAKDVTGDLVSKIVNISK